MDVTASELRIEREDGVVLAAARALAEEELRLPSGWQNPSFHWLRGTARPLSVENGCIRLRYPDVVEVLRS